MNGLDLTYTQIDEPIDWSWFTGQLMEFRWYCEADVALTERLYAILVGPPMLEDLAALNAAIWKKEN